MASYKENEQFASTVIDTGSLLDSAIEYIQSNLSPGDVFNIIDLDTWAEENGYVKG